MSNLIGQVLSDRYRVDAFIGRGGMAEVFKVWDSKRAACLAIKLLHDDLAEDKVFLRRFEREADTLARLQHPNIVRFYGLEKAGSLVFMLMDFVDGGSLRREINETDRPLPFTRIHEVMRSVCSALHFAHEQGLVHCDIKPANILIDKTGRLLLSDFGIARMAESATTTMAGAGTPAYMAPEQARGDSSTPQTDIYASGIVLFEMLTGGARPFTGENARVTGTTGEKVRWEQLHLAPPRPSQWNRQITAGLDEVVLRCLEKSPGKRYASTLDLLAALEQTPDFAAGQPEASGVPPAQVQQRTAVPISSAANVTATRRKPQPVLLGIIALVAVVLIAIAFFTIGKGTATIGGLTATGTAEALYNAQPAIPAAQIITPDHSPTPGITPVSPTPSATTTPRPTPMSDPQALARQAVERFQGLRVNAQHTGDTSQYSTVLKGDALSSSIQAVDTYKNQGCHMDITDRAPMSFAFEKLSDTRVEVTAQRSETRALICPKSTKYYCESYEGYYTVERLADGWYITDKGVRNNQALQPCP
jgi:eukaryotic-like serine/threonine-protein kinase